MAKRKYNVTLARRAQRMLLAHTEFLSRVSVTAARRLLAYRDPLLRASRQSTARMLLITQN